MIDKRSLAKLRNKIRSKAPYGTVGGLSPSRRYLGQYSSGVEARHYRAVMCYLQKGLGSYQELIEQIMKVVIECQSPTQSTNPYHLCLFSFAWGDNKLHHGGQSIYIRHKGNYKSITQSLCDLAGRDNISDSPIIPALFPPVGLYSQPIRRVAIEDLLVFFCRNRSVRIQEYKIKQYKACRRRALWVFLDGEAQEWEFGKFIPETIVEET